MFNINDHIVQIPDRDIERVVKPAFEFFEKTPYHELVNLPMFEGAGVYALFLKTTAGTHYEVSLPPMYPIYIGKASPAGSRQGRKATTKKARPLRDRVRKHGTSIGGVDNLDKGSFVCRFMIMQGRATDMISAMESYLIRQYEPLWNSYIDGFGINAPGKGRYEQQPSEWDTLHPGRSYVEKLTGAPRDINEILLKIQNYKVKKKT